MRQIMFIFLFLICFSLYADELTKQQQYNLKEATWHVKKAEDAKYPYSRNAAIKSAEKYITSLIKEIPDNVDVVAIQKRYEKLVLQKTLQETKKKLYSVTSNAKTYLRSFNKTGKLPSWQKKKVAKYKEEIQKHQTVLEEHKADYADILKDSQAVLQNIDQALGVKEQTQEAAPQMNTWAQSRLKQLDKTLASIDKALEDGSESRARVLLQTAQRQKAEFDRMYGAQVSKDHPLFVSVLKKLVSTTNRLEQIKNTQKNTDGMTKPVGSKKVEEAEVGEVSDSDAKETEVAETDATEEDETVEENAESDTDVEETEVAETDATEEDETVEENAESDTDVKETEVVETDATEEDETVEENAESDTDVEETEVAETDATEEDETVEENAESDTDVEETEVVETDATDENETVEEKPLDRMAEMRLSQLEKTFDRIEESLEKNRISSAKSYLRTAVRQQQSFIQMYGSKVDMNHSRILKLKERYAAVMKKMQGGDTATTAPKTETPQPGPKLASYEQNCVKRMKEQLEIIKQAVAQDNFAKIPSAYRALEREAGLLQSRRVPLTHPQIKPILVELQGLMIKAKSRREKVMAQQKAEKELAKKREKEAQELAKKREKVERALRDGKRRLEYAESVLKGANASSSLSYNSNYRNAIESLNYALQEVEGQSSDSEVQKFIAVVSEKKEQAMASLVKDNCERLAKLVKEGDHLIAVPSFVDEIYKDVASLPAHLKVYETKLEEILISAGERTNKVLWDDVGLHVEKKEKLFGKHLRKIANKHPKWQKLIGDYRAKIINKVLQYGLDVSAKYPDMSAMSRNRHLQKHLDWAQELVGDRHDQKIVDEGKKKYEAIFDDLQQKLAQEKAAEAEKQRKEMELAKKRHEAFLKSLSPQRLEVYQEWDKKRIRPRNANANVWVFYESTGSGRDKVGVEHTYTFNEAGELLSHDKKTEDSWLTLHYNGRVLAHVFIEDRYGYAGYISKDKRGGTAFRNVRIQGKPVRANVGALHIEINDKWEEVVDHNFYNSDVQVKYWSRGRMAKGAIHEEKGFIIKADLEEYKKRIGRITGSQPGAEAVYYAIYFAVAHLLIN